MPPSDKPKVPKVPAHKADKHKQKKKVTPASSRSSDRSDVSSSAAATRLSSPEKSTNLFSVPEDAPAELFDSHNTAVALAVDAHSALSNAELEMLGRDEALLSRLQALLPTLTAAAQHEAEVASGEAAATAAAGATAAAAAGVGGDGADVEDAVVIRQRLMDACSHARQSVAPRNSSRSRSSRSSHGGAAMASERQLREALHAAYRQIDAMATEAADLRVRCASLEAQLLGESVDELSVGEGTPYYMPDGACFVVSEKAEAAAFDLYEVPPWWGKANEQHQLRPSS